jgi:hypothetical protein
MLEPDLLSKLHAWSMGRGIPGIPDTQLRTNSLGSTLREVASEALEDGRDRLDDRAKGSALEGVENVGEDVNKARDDISNKLSDEVKEGSDCAEEELHSGAENVVETEGAQDILGDTDKLVEELDDKAEDDLDVGKLDIDGGNILELVDDGGEEVVQDGNVLVDVGDGGSLGEGTSLDLGDGGLCSYVLASCKSEDGNRW